MNLVSLNGHALYCKKPSASHDHPPEA